MATYATTAQVKTYLTISAATYDSLIDDLRDQVYAKINGNLRDYISVPLSGGEADYNTIVLIEKILVAGYFRLGKDEPVGEGIITKAEQLLKQGMELLDEWINEHFVKSKGDVAGSRDIKQNRGKKFWETL